MTWAAAYIGRTDMHCWGLVRAVYSALCGITLPEYGEVDAKELRGVAAAVGAHACLPPWQPVKRGLEQEFDVLVMKGWLPCSDGKLRRGTIHAGVITRPGYVLHTDIKYAVVEVPLTHTSVKGRIVDCYRHQVLARRAACT